MERIIAKNNLNIQLFIQYCYRMSAKACTALTWISTNFQYPNCRKVCKLADLKSGVAVAEVLIELLPSQFHQILLTKIEVSKLHSDACITNWRVLKQTLLHYLRNTEAQQLMPKLAALTPEALYYRDQDLITFVAEILMSLWRFPPRVLDEQDLLKYSSAVKSHLSSVHGKNSTHVSRQKSTFNNNANINLSQLSDIAHTSILGGPAQTTMLHNHAVIQDEVVETYQKHELECRKPPVPLSQVSLLQAWMVSKLGEDIIAEEPHEQLGHLLNVIFCSSRLNCPIVKNAQFKHGALFVYKKVLEFLVQDSRAERVSKASALEIMRAIEEFGIVRETEYWRLINDLHNFDLRNGKADMSRLSRKRQINHEDMEKENKHPNVYGLAKQQSKKVLQSCKTSKQMSKPSLDFRAEDLIAIQRWLQEQMGLEHSLAKIHTQKQIFCNPLVNGTIAATILMRFKLGKVTINKCPLSMQDVRSNWEMLNKICCLRNFESLKPVCAYLFRFNSSKADQECINTLLHYLHLLKLEYERKQPKFKKAQQTTECNQCEDEYVVKISPSANQKLELQEWLSSNFGIRIDELLTVSQLTSICREVLHLNIYKQTTPRIQANNVDKILAQLRRIGLGDYYSINKDQLMDPGAGSLRWKILADLRWLIEGKIVFCRA